MEAANPVIDNDRALFEASANVEIVTSFAAMGIKEDLLRGLYNYGFEKPSAIQQRATVPVLKGKDVIIQAQPGTGKSSLASLAVCQMVDTKVQEIPALILSSTREIAVQTQKVISAIGVHLNIQAHACVGGTSIGEDTWKLEYGVHVVAGTPGRVFDMIKRQALRTRAIKLLVLNVADDLLSSGFKNQIYDIYRYLPQDLQVVLCSTMLPVNVLEMTKKFMTDPILITVKGDELSMERFKQFFVAVEREEWKFNTLCDLFETLTTIPQMIIFVNTKRKVDWLTEKVRGKGFAVSSIHGGIPQKDWEAYLEEVTSRVLIATDVWARGPNVQRVPVVVNYDLPKNHELYLQRAGRPAAERKGVVINFVRKDDIKLLRDIEVCFSIQIGEMPMSVAELV